MSGLNRIQAIHATYAQEIQDAALNFGDTGINEGKILSWISNFTDSDLKLAIKVLGKVRYYSSSSIWSMARELAMIVKKAFAPVPMEKVVFVPIGGPYSSSATVARALRQTGEVQAKNIKYMLELEKTPGGHLGAIVLLDDFSGTGDTLAKWWPIAEPIVLPKAVPYALGLLVLNDYARAAIEEFVEKIYCIEELGKIDNMLSSESTHFDPGEKGSLLQYCRTTGYEYVRGYGDCGLLMAFKHGCPNNSLPILWYDSPSWKPLFKRRDT